MRKATAKRIRKHGSPKVRQHVYIRKIRCNDERGGAVGCHSLEAASCERRTDERVADRVHAALRSCGNATDGH